MLPLEDTFADIVGKAMRGLQLTDAQLAPKAGVSADALHRLRDGAWDETTARAVAPLLGLKADALCALGHRAYTPAPVALDGLAQFNTPFEDMTVNSYLAWDAATGDAIAFDTGADCTDLLALVAEKKLHVRLILLTHTHGDHIFDLDRLKAQTGAPAFTGDREPLDGAESFASGRSWTVGSLQIASRLTWGHSKGGITFVLTGLAKPVAIVGDAIFAGSMGGGGISYPAALQTNREEILTLPSDTILCPGHGPMTTVAAERAHNPFF